jgi:hypothetical protein
MSDGTYRLAEDLVPGDKVSMVYFGDDSTNIDHNPYVYHLEEWESTDSSEWGVKTGTIASMSFLADSSYYSINESLKVTYEHHILIKRSIDNNYVFIKAEDVSIGDYLVKEDLSEEEIVSVVFENEDILSVCIDTSPFNMFIAGDGYIVHNEGPGGPLEEDNGKTNTVITSVT